MAYKVLLVEDNTDCRELLAAVLGHLGYHVLQAENGAVAIQKAVNENPDLILMDLRMPNMDGLQATSCLREIQITKDTPIIICSASVQRRHHDSALKSGAHEVVTKPFSIKQIESLMLRYLPRPGGRDESVLTEGDFSPRRINFSTTNSAAVPLAFQEPAANPTTVSSGASGTAP